MLIHHPGRIFDGRWPTERQHHDSNQAAKHVHFPSTSPPLHHSEYADPRLCANVFTDLEIDYTKMTISGSLLNGDATTRNIGVAFVFRDAHGNQIGQETVVIENARPDVPYPFTGELVMASDLPFASHTSWVLFADTSPPANTSSPPSGQPSNPIP